MPEIRRRRWSADEDAKIRELYPTHGMSWDGWAAELPGRSAQAIQRRASDIGISKKAWWSTSEDSKIVELFPAHGRDWDGWAVELPARKPRAIADRARHLGVKGSDRKADKPKARAVPSSPGPIRATHPSNTTTKPHRPSRPWTDEQRASLVKLAQSAVDETHHSLGECAVELARIIQETRANRKGKKS